MNLVPCLSGGNCFCWRRRPPIPKRTVGKQCEDASRYYRLLASMQRLRGRCYVTDGAISTRELTSDGRHIQSIDRQSWHVLSVDSRDRVSGCARYRPFDYEVAFDQLGVGKSELANSEVWRSKLQAAIYGAMHKAYSQGISFVEVGGWALAQEMRHGTEALRIALASYSLAEALGGCIWGNHCHHPPLLFGNPSQNRRGVPCSSTVLIFPAISTTVITAIWKSYASIRGRRIPSIFPGSSG